MNSVRRRNASAWLIPNNGTRTNTSLRAAMRRYDPADEVDLVVVGCGAGGSVLAQRLARRGWSIVAFDAGPFWDPDADWVSDEAGSHKLYWNEPRVIAGRHPVPLGSNNSGTGRRRLHGALRRVRPTLSPVGFPHLLERRGGSRLAHVLRRAAALLRAAGAGAPGSGAALALGGSARIPAVPPQRLGQRGRFLAELPGPVRSRHASGRWPS